MAKKSRKTRKEKQAPKKHEFNPYVRARQIASTEKSDDASVDRNKPQIPDYVYKDFKKITFIMGVFIVGLVVLALIANKTGLLNPVFNLFNIKY